MEIQINTDNHIDGYQRMQDYYAAEIAESLERFQDKITNLHVFLVDENSDKESSGDKRCSMEARLKGLNPVAVVNHADTIELAVKGAIDKLKKVLDTTYEKMRNY
jgi:ribosome-associated translation inhibitor RaiA